MDGDQQLNLYYCYSVAIMNRFICQPKFAGKTYMKFEGQELKQRTGIYKTYATHANIQKICKKYAKK